MNEALLNSLKRLQVPQVLGPSGGAFSGDQIWECDDRNADVTPVCFNAPRVGAIEFQTVNSAEDVDARGATPNQTMSSALPALSPASTGSGTPKR